MKILVSDTSVLVDLDRGGLLEAVFSCGLTLVVPDFLYERELEGNNGPYLMALGLSVVKLDSDEVEFAQRIYSERPALSLADCSALVCAHRPDHVLLSGDRALRNEATKRVGKVFGLLWVLDTMYESGAVDPKKIFEGLSQIMQHPRCRLPRDEVTERLKKWM